MVEDKTFDGRKSAGVKYISYYPGDTVYYSNTFYSNPVLGDYSRVHRVPLSLDKIEYDYFHENGKVRKRRKFKLNEFGIERSYTKNVPAPIATFYGSPSWGRATYQGDAAAYVWAYGNLSTVPGIYYLVDGHRQSQDIALVKSINKMSEVTFETATWLAELSETISMLKDPLAALKRFLKLDDARMKSTTPFNAVKDFYADLTDLTAAAWLQYRYGVRPLIMDVQNAMTAVQMKLQKDLDTVKIHRRRSRAPVKSLHAEAYTNWMPLVMNADVEYSVHRDIVNTSRATVYYRCNHNFINQQLFEKWGFTPWALPVAAWERVPFSFVYDWFSDVGSWIRSLEPRLGQDIVGITTSDRISFKGHVTTSRLRRIVEGTSQVVPFHSTFTVENEYYYRYLRTSTITTPKWNPRFKSLERAIDAVSLAWVLTPKNRSYYRGR